jgi:hypothetical protein
MSEKSYDHAATVMRRLADGVLIRTLDLNDSYSGPRQIGHPSDNIGAALAAAEMADRSGSISFALFAWATKSMAGCSTSVIPTAVGPRHGLRHRDRGHNRLSHTALA